MTLLATDFLKRFANLSENMHQQGYRFERLIQEWLISTPIHKDKYKKVYLWRDWARLLGINQTDTGIDLVAETHDGEYCAIQCKNYAADGILPLANLTNFTSALNSQYGGQTFISGIVVSTSRQWSNNAQKAIENLTIDCQRIDFIDELSNADIDWAAVNNLLPQDETHAIAEKPIASSFPVAQTVDLSDLLKKLFADTEKPKNTPRPHQKEAIDKVIAGFKTADRGKMIMACGTGKTFTALKIAEKITADKNDNNGNNGNILFLVPSLSLLSQALKEWSRERKNPLRVFAVCSDVKVGRQDADDISARDLAIPATTNSKKLSAKLKNSTTRMSVVFATYQSIKVIHEAQQHGAPDFDLIICDEAHRTTGVEKQHKENGEQASHFIQVHNGDYIRATKRLYMTATPRIYGDSAKSKANALELDYYSMDDPQQYGAEFYRLGFAQAVEKKLLSDYKVLIVSVNENRITQELLNKVSEIEIKQTGRGKKYEINNEELVKIIGCWKGLSKKIKAPALAHDTNPMRRAVIFSNKINHSIAITTLFAGVIDEFNGVDNNDAQSDDSQDKGFLHCQVQHVDGTQDALMRNEKLNWLKQEPHGNGCHLLSNVRCLSEGVDVPALDAVVFLSPRNSQVDIVQSVGRVMRVAPGKKEGYIILPVIAPEDETAEMSLEKNDSYRVVWEILKALRSHDERLDVEINQLDLNEKRNPRIIVSSDDDEDGDRNGRGGGDSAESIHNALAQSAIQFDRTPFENAIYAAIVEKCGDRKYIEKWAKDVAVVARKTTARIKDLLINDANAKKHYDKFLSGLQKNLNPSVTTEAAIEMLSQHLITRPIFDTLFGSEEFVAANPVSKTMQSMLDCFEQKNIAKETQGLEAFYEDMNRYLSGIDNPKGKQTVINELYEKFFKNAFPKMAESLGIVYTPIEVVDFMIRSIDDLLKQEFGRGISDEKVNLLDPFTGTGTFITRLLESNTIADKDLRRKYMHEIYANEIVLLAYYIAAINIEQSYQARLSNSQKTNPSQNNAPQPYQSFSGIALTDTFQIDESDDALVQKPMENVPALQQNSERIEQQRKTPITVVFGNPPYSALQKSENDDNPNLKYERLDASIAESYVEHSTATNKTKIYDSYIRAIRWASDRIGDEGVVAYISNGGYIDGNAMDGLRKCLANEFNSVYVLNLRGNIRKSMGNKKSGEGGNIFGQGSMTGIAILFLVKNGQSNFGKIYYHNIGDNLSRTQKLTALNQLPSIDKIPWQTITPDENNDWINQQTPEFTAYLPMGDKANKTKAGTPIPSVFSLYILGVSTNRDSWVYNFDKAQLAKNMQSMVDFYNNEVARYQQANANGAAFKENNDSTKISWSSSLHSALKREAIGNFHTDNIRLGLYRPFIKQYLYFDSVFIHRPAIAYQYFPTPESVNLAICVNGLSASADFSVLMIDTLPDLNVMNAGTQCFPRYTFLKNTSPAAKEKYERIDNIPPATVTTFRKQYNDKSINGDDIFYYVYGILHNQKYKTKFANDLKKTLPRIPFAKTLDDFKIYAKAGKHLADLHVNYETAEPYPLLVRENKKTDSANYFAVKAMKYANKNDRSTIIYNQNITIEKIPPEAHQYIVNGKPALDWIMDRYKIKTDKDSQLTNDPNQWSDDPRYIIELIRKVVMVSVQTVKIVNALPAL